MALTIHYSAFHRVYLLNLVRKSLETERVDSLSHRLYGCLPFSQKIQKFWFEVKWKGDFPENLFGNCGQLPEVVLFFCSERNLGNALTICDNRCLSRPFLTRSSKYAELNGE